jgi:hypothetical protein
VARKVLEERHHVGLALLTVLRESAHDGLLHRLRDHGRPRRGDLEGIGSLRQVLGGPLPRRLRLEGELAREHLVRHHAKRIHIASTVELLARELLRAHVRRRAEYHALLRELLFLLDVGRFRTRRDPEVQDLGEVLLPRARREHDVVRLQVPVHDALLVGFRERTTHLPKDVFHPGRGHRAFLLHDVADRPAVDELHCDEQGPVRRLAEVEELDRVGVLELRHRAALAVEPRHDLRVLGQVRVQRLDGDLAGLGPHLLLAFVDPAHPSFTQQADHTKRVLDDHADHAVVFLRRLARQEGSTLRAEASIVHVRVLTRRAFHLVPPSQSPRSTEPRYNA